MRGCRTGRDRERLQERHRGRGSGTRRHGRVAQNPLARLVDVVPRGEVHHRVSAPDGAPLQLLNLLQQAIRSALRGHPIRWPCQLIDWSQCLHKSLAGGAGLGAQPG